MHIRALSAPMHHFDSLCIEMCGFPVASRNQQCLRYSSQAPPRTASWQQPLNLTEPARTYPYQAGRLPFSDYGHTFSSQSGICKGNYTSHQDEILPKKEVKTRGCRRKHGYLCRSSQSPCLALNSFSTDVTNAPRPPRICHLSTLTLLPGCSATIILFFKKW